jgi:hypothetical protein
MKLHRKHISVLLGVATFCVAMNSSALTLGRAKGSVFLGQSLRLTVPVLMELGEGGSSLCFEADVFYGDTRQDASRVSVSNETQAQSQSAIVTVIAQATVDEPVVTVYLRAGCENKTTRRYVMLAEPVANELPSQSAVNLPITPPLSRAVSSTQTPAYDNGAPSAVPVQRATKRAKTGVQEAKTETSAQATPVPKSPKAESRHPRLRLAPLDLTQIGDPTLKLSETLVVGDGEDKPKRARAIAEWSSLNASPTELLAAQNRQQALEADLKGLHDITVKNRQVLEDLARRLGRAERERYSNPLVYGLLVAVIVCALGIALGWNRAPRGGPWWREEGTEERSAAADREEEEQPKPSDESLQPGDGAGISPKATALAPTKESVLGVTNADIDLELDDPVDDTRHAALPVGQLDHNRSKVNIPEQQHIASQADFAPSMSATLRSVNTKEMLDVRQQAEFFMTLGQNEAAIALLRESVDVGVDANPLVHLELLKVLHTLGRKAEFDHYRSGFNTIFNGHVPIYTEFNRSGSGLEAYPEVCQEIVSLWPTVEAIDYIESCLVRRRKESSRQDFDLEAFQDLLILHGVANRLATTTFDSGLMAFSAAKSSLGPVATTSSSELDLDLGISATHGALPDNLIDFDASGWSAAVRGDSQAKPH